MRNFVLCVFTLFFPVFALSQNVYKPQIDPEFEPYVQNFIDLSMGVISREMDFNDVTIHFADLKGNTVGTCLALPWKREIEIDRMWWLRNQIHMVREELIFHEFGHCILYRPHTVPKEDKNIESWIERMLYKIGILKRKHYLEDGCPASYMHPYTVGYECIHKHYRYYLEELFANFESEIVEEEVVEDYSYKTL